MIMLLILAMLVCLVAKVNPFPTIASVGIVVGKIVGMVVMSIIVFSLVFSVFKH
jgi:hypothetical protein